MMDHLGIIRELKHDESVLCLNTCWTYIILAWNKSFRKDLFGSQPPLELLRQWIDYGCWYDRLKQTLRPCSRRHSSTTAPDSTFFAVSRVFSLSGTYKESQSMKKDIKRLQAAKATLYAARCGVAVEVLFRLMLTGMSRAFTWSQQWDHLVVAVQ